MTLVICVTMPAYTPKSSYTLGWQNPADPTHHGVLLNGTVWCVLFVLMTLARRLSDMCRS
jgi:hypothetical protein